MDQPIKKILIIRFSSIGDIVLTTPVIRCIKMQLPDTSIHYLTKPAYLDILVNNPYIDKILLLDKHPFAKGLELQKEHYNLVIDLHHNLRTLLLKTALGVKSFAFPKLNIEKFLMVNFKINKLPKKHIVARYFEPTRILGIKNDDEGLDYFIPETDAINVLEDLPLLHTQYICWAIGAQHFTKRLPEHKIIEACKKTNLNIIILGGKDDAERGNKIKQAIGERCINACGKLTLNQSAWVIKHSLRLYTNDTGLMHIAAALKKPIISFWGNTIPAFGMYPYYGKYIIENSIIENNNLSCRPCSKIGYIRCPKGHFKCMEKLEMDREMRDEK